MGKLAENFNKVDRTIKKQIDLLDRKKLFEKENKDSEILSEYLKILNGLDRIDQELSDAKTYMYDDMLEEEIDELNGINCDITLKRPYEKTEFNIKKFLDDYKPADKLYQKYVSKKLVKGNIILKVLNENKR